MSSDIAVSSKAAFKLHDAVVYPSHGVGKIVGIEEQNISGIIILCFVVKFDKEKMTLRVPVKRAVSCGLRAVLSQNEFEENIFKTLLSRPKLQKGMWSRREQEYENKINSGDPYLTAEVVRDLFKNVNDNPDCSYSERMIYEVALHRLAAEYSAIAISSSSKSTQNTDFNATQNMEKAIGEIVKVLSEKEFV